MSAITPEEIESAISFSRRAIELHESRSAPWAKAIVALADERNALRAEVEALRHEVELTNEHEHQILTERNDARAEAEQARIELEDERDRVNVQREDIRALRGEVQRLTEEARRSDAGRVEVPEFDVNKLDLFEGSWSSHDLRVFIAGAKEGHRALASRLSPSPQPACMAVERHVRDDNQVKEKK